MAGKAGAAQRSCVAPFACQGAPHHYSEAKNKFAVRLCTPLGKRLGTNKAAKSRADVIIAAFPIEI